MAGLEKYLASAVAVCSIGWLGAVPIAESAPVDDAPLSTPPGVMLVDVMQFITNTSAQFLWRRLGDENGRPLYTYDQDEPGKSNCRGECTRDFVAFAAPGHARAMGDWGLLRRPEGIVQWTYQGRPLYRYTGVDPKGEPAGGGGNNENNDLPEYHDPGSSVYSPKPGWRRAAYTPEKTIKVPAGIELRSMMVANGYALVTADAGKTIYVFDDAVGSLNPLEWAPVPAPLFSVKIIGDFSVVVREDGKRQWAYKGKPLYTFRADSAKNDIRGLDAGVAARVALVYKHYIPDSVAINSYPRRGPLMVKKDDGMTIYTQTRYHLQYGGRQWREGYRYTYLDAKGVGVEGCTEACTNTWRPFLAPDDAHSSGFWEVAVRPDGTKQWVFRGAHLYTFARDTKPGDIYGNNRHDILWGDAQGKVDLRATGDGDPRYNLGAGFYWHTAGLYN